DIATLAAELSDLRQARTANLQHGLLLKGHGLYTWGSDFLEAKRHVEVLEFLFEVTGRGLTLSATSPSRAWSE
ncbi:MAG: class II aldolase/adducin family protein, partial [Planctomycetota bacterium]